MNFEQKILTEQQNILSFFEVSGEKIEKVDKLLLKELGIEKFENILEGYKKYIEENFSNLPKDQVDKIKLSIIRKFNSLKLNDFLESKRKEITEKILNIKKEINVKKTKLKAKIKLLEEQHKNHKSTISLQNLREAKKELETLENTYIPKVKDFRWEINEEITNKFNFVNNELLPSLAFYSKNYDIIKQYNDTKDNAFLYKIAGNDMYHLEDKIEDINELLKAPIDEEGNFDEGFFSTQNILSIENGLDKGILEGVKIPEGISILAEKDKEIQAKAMATYIAYVLVMIVPYAGDLASLPADIRDLITDKEGTLTQLKSMGLVQEEFNMKKEMWDYIFGGVGILASIASLVPLISVAGQGVKEVLKSEKLAKAYKIVSKLGISKEKFGEMLEESTEVLKKSLGDGLYALGTNIQKHPVGKMMDIRMKIVDDSDAIIENTKKIEINEILEFLKGHNINISEDSYKYISMLDKKDFYKLDRLLENGVQIGVLDMFNVIHKYSDKEINEIIEVSKYINDFSVQRYFEDKVLNNGEGIKKIIEDGIALEALSIKNIKLRLEKYGFHIDEKDYKYISMLDEKDFQKLDMLFANGVKIGVGNMFNVIHKYSDKEINEIIKISKNVDNFSVQKYFEDIILNNGKNIDRFRSLKKSINSDYEHLINMDYGDININRVFEKLVLFSDNNKISDYLKFIQHHFPEQIEGNWLWKAVLEDNFISILNADEYRLGSIIEDIMDRTYYLERVARGD